MKNDYKTFYKGKKEEEFKQAALSPKEKMNQMLDKVQDYLSKIVLKFNLNFCPINIILRDHFNEELFKMCINLAEVELHIDHVYERKNIMKCLGMSMERFTGIEQKKTDITL